METGEYRILAQLRRRERLWLVKVGAMLLCGLPLSLIGPALVATLFWTTFLLWGHRAPWVWFLLGFGAVLVPLLYRLEIQTQGDYLGRAARDFKPNGAIATGALALGFDDVAMIAAALANPRASVAGFVEIFLFGPRLVVSAVRQVRLRRLSRGADRSRAAAVLQALAAGPTHLRTDSLLKPGEPPPQLSRVLAYLLFFNWIGVAHDGGKAWVLTESRRLLGQTPELVAS